MTRLEFVTLICKIQGRDTTPNWRPATYDGLRVTIYYDAENNSTVIETSNTHDYMMDSYGNETWVYNEKMLG